MDGYDVNQWDRVGAKAKDLGLALDVSGPNLRLFRSGAQLGVFATVDQLSYFVDGYDWGRQVLSRPKTIVETVGAKPGPDKFNEDKVAFGKLPKAVKAELKAAFKAGEVIEYWAISKWVDCNPVWAGGVPYRVRPGKAAAKPGPAYKLWGYGDKLPAKLPAGCERVTLSGGWEPEKAHPRNWGMAKRRWPKKG